MRALIALATAATIALLGGCGSTTAEDDPGDATSTSTSPSVTESATDEPSDEPSDDPSDGESSEPTEEPETVALGQQVSLDGMTMRLPKGWADVTDQAETGALFTGAATGADELPDMVMVSLFDHVATTTDDAAEHAQGALEGTGEKNIRRLDDVQIDGAEASHVQAHGGDAASPTVIDRYDVVAGEQAWVVTFQVNRYLQPARRQALMDAVLGSIAWK